MSLKNSKNIPLPFAVFLATDTYDMIPAPNKISVTTLLKSPRRIVLGTRQQGEGDVDLSSLVSASVGTAIHAALEAAWQKPQEVLKLLGYPAKVADSLEMNPTNPVEGGLYGYTELRTEKPIAGYTISGSCDFILDGVVYDYKTVGIFKYNKGDYSDYITQMSLYRWLNQDKITHDEGRIELYIRDWDSLKASYDASYPQTPFVEVRVQLMSLTETERFIRNKLQLLTQYQDTPEADLPHCTPSELWQSEPTWQYVSKGGAKKNFPTSASAQAYLAQKGTGSVTLKPAKAKACNWCPVRSSCSQATALAQAGLLDPL